MEFHEEWGPCPADSCESDEQTRFFYKKEEETVHVDCTRGQCSVQAAVSESTAQDLLGEAAVKAMKEYPA